MDILCSIIMIENVGNLNFFLLNVIVERRRRMIKGDLDCSSDFRLAAKCQTQFHSTLCLVSVFKARVQNNC